MPELLTWIQENISGKLKGIALAVVIVGGILGWLSQHKDIFKTISDKFTTAKTHKTEYLTDGPVRVRENFQFRDELVNKWSKEIWKARKTRQNKFLIHGFGGVGKTAVAAALYDELEDKCQQIGWVECRKSGSLRDSLLTAIDTGDGEKTTEERWAEIKHLLRNATGKTILFLDNVDRPDDLLTELRRYKLTVIVTSRMERVEDYTPIPIPPLSEDECVELFRSYCSRTVKEQDEPVVRELVHLVSCHTLSVELLAKSVPPKARSLAEYLEQLKAGGFKSLDLKPQTGYVQKDQTVVDHLKKLFDMEGLDAEETRVMRNLALMADSRTLPPEVQNWIDCDVNALQSLVNTGWLSKAEDERGYEVHPIVRAVVLLDEVPVAAVENFLHFVAYENYFQDGEDYRTVQFKLGVVEAVLEQVEDRLEKSWDTSVLYSSLGNVYDSQGKYVKAENYHGKALSIDLTELNRNYVDIATDYNNLGTIYCDQGKYAQAEACHKKALDIRLNIFDKVHLDTAHSYNNLGNVYSNQDRYIQAEECHREALNIRLELLGKEHEDTATSYNNLGKVYDDQGKYVQAEEYHRKALDIRLKVLGENHPDTASSYNNLGVAYKNQGKNAQAESYYRKALNIRLKVLGENHPDTASSYNNIGNIYCNQGKYMRAEKQLKKALNIRLKVLGENHPDTASSYNNLGAVYGNRRNYTKATEHFLKAWKIWKQRLGPEHSHTKLAENNLRDCFPYIDHGDQDFDTWLSQQ